MISKIIEDFLANTERSTMTLPIQIHTDEDPSVRKFRVSDAGRCRLYRYWKRQGKDQPPKDMDLLKVMEVGTLIHAWLEYALNVEGVLYHSEVVLEDDHRSGHLDAIVEGDHGSVIIYDFKTIGGRQAYYMLNSGAKAKKEHVYQVLTYLEMCNDTTRIIDSYAANILMTPKSAHIAYILREEMSGKKGDKLPPLTVIADIRADLDLLPAVRQDWQILIDAWKKQEEPQANPEQWECKFCPYKKGCHFLNT